MLQSAIIIAILVLTQRQKRISGPSIAPKPDKARKCLLRFRKAILVIEQAAEPPPAFIPERVQSHAVGIERNRFVQTVGRAGFVGLFGKLFKAFLRFVRYGPRWIRKREEHKKGNDCDHKEKYTWGGLDKPPHA